MLRRILAAFRRPEQSVAAAVRADRARAAALGRVRAQENERALIHATMVTMRAQLGMAPL